MPSGLSVPLGRHSLWWGCSRLPHAALNPQLPVKWGAGRPVSSPQHFRRLQELSLPGCDWVGLKQSLAVVQSLAGWLWVSGLTLSQECTSSSQATVCENGKVGFCGGNWAAITKEQGGQEQTYSTPSCRGTNPVLSSQAETSRSSRPLLAGPPRSSPADLIRSFTDTN